VPLCDIKETTFPFSVRASKNQRLFWVVDERTGEDITKKTQRKELAVAWAKKQKLEM